MSFPRRPDSGWTSRVVGVFLGAIALGADVDIRGDFDRPVHFGLDWFLLNLLVFALVFVPLERPFPLKPGQRALRAGRTRHPGPRSSPAA